MARPKKDSPGDAAALRLRNAFMAELAITPYAKMSVAKVVTRAEVNRNTFYYHYDCMDDLARECVRQELPTQLAKRVILKEISSRNTTREYLDELAANGTLDRLRLISGPHGSGILGEMVRDEICSFWLKTFGLAFDDLRDVERMAVMFTSSGLVSMVSQLAEGFTLERMYAYMSSDFFAQASGAMVGILEGAHARKYPEGE